MKKTVFEFISSAVTPYHTVEALRRELLEKGYTELFENDSWELEDGKGYFVTRNGSSLIAFKYLPSAIGFTVCASHSDFPAFKVKESMETVGFYNRIDVEKYGGMIYYSWLDRPLSVAGRVLLRTESGLEARLVRLKGAAASIPSAAIHLNRAVNDGVKLNPAQHLLPLFSKRAEKGGLLSLVAEELGTDKENIVSHDLSLFVNEEPVSFGGKDEFILSPRLDDLACVYATAKGFFEAEAKGNIPVLAVFDNEEVGSQTKQGADSDFLFNTLSNIAGESLYRMLASSFMVSADNAHARHPSYPELSDAENAPTLGEGVVIKHNASQRYATDGLSSAIFSEICKKAGVKLQSYYNRADMPGGSTLGSISDSRVSIPTVDIGVPQLAMHSAVETAALSDISDLALAASAVYSARISIKGDKVELL